MVVMDVGELEKLLEAAVARALSKRSPGEADWLDVHGAGALGIGPRKFRALLRCGAVPGSRVGRKLVAKRADLEAWVQAQPVARAESVAGDDPVADLLSKGRLRVVGTISHARSRK